MEGMPRRVYTYPPGLGWETLNLVASTGVVFMSVAVLLFVANVVMTLMTSSRSAAPNPWDAGSLEWATSSPPPAANFHPLLTVGSTNPLWEDPPQPVIVGVRADQRQVLVTQLLDATPDHLYLSPQPTIWPFAAAVATTAMFVGSIFTPWAVVWGSVPMAITFIGWFWPKQSQETPEERVPELPRQRFTSESAA
jgi:cytochrome c oxidase subunit 1